MMSHLSILILASTLGQVPAESGWLNSVPTDADVVIRGRGLLAVKDDLAAMLKAMSPAYAARFEPSLEQAVVMVKAQVSEQAATGPFLVLFRGVKPEGPGTPPFAVILNSPDYQGVLKSLTDGKNLDIKHLDAGYDSFNGLGGQTWFAAKGDGSIAFGTDKILVEGYRKPGDKALGKTLSPGLRRKFLAGDIGVYVNIAALATRYAGPIKNAEQSFFTTFDKPGPGMGTGMVEYFKAFYGKMFDSIKEADLLALSVEFSGEGLSVSGVQTVKADSKAIKTIAGFQNGQAAQLARLSANSADFFYMNLGAELFQSMQTMGLQMMTLGGTAHPELAAAIAKEHGSVEMIASISLGDGIKTFQMLNLSNPMAYMTASEGVMKLMQNPDSPMNFYKDVRVTPNAETYRGFSFSRFDMSLDYEKFAKSQPNVPTATAMMKAMYGTDPITTWLGASDKQMVQLIAPTWADAKSQIDGYLKGDEGIGAAAGFKTTLAKLPAAASIVALVSAQGIARQLSAQFAMVMPNAPKLAPADLPKDPALIGFSLSPAGPDAVEFRLIVPSTVGPVFEKALTPTPASQPTPVKP